ncbi:MAG TPA: efflux RND transporter permease subunit, partial [Candidatus Ozemobacteraceae bacterium]|nr:efflux RND transporter permease subunit [Candidatus Ozemobacteraceae bacterium]
MNIVELSIKRPVMMTMVLLFLIVLGLFSYGKIPIDMLPKIDFPMVTVVTAYPGASPKNIETLISQKIEDAVSAINGIDELKSDSYEGFSNVLIRFEDYIDVDTAAADVREKVGAIRDKLPDDAKEPVILKLDINALPILSLAISGNRPVESTYALAKDLIRDEIRRVDGVADLDFIGAREREITIQIDQGIAKAFQISPISLAGMIAQKSLNIPSGHITQTRKEYNIRMDGEFTSVREIRELPIPTAGGKTYTLGDIAQVTDEYEEFRQAVRLNDRPCIAMIVKKRSDANSVRTAEGVLKRLEELKSKLPRDIEFTPVRNRATFIVDSVDDLNGNLIAGIIITAIILFLFLHSFKATLVSVLSIPISIVATYTLVYAFGFSLNMMSLMALAISVGILVNNAIIVLENIYVHLQKSKQSPKEAAITGTNEILVAVAGCTLTNVLVFTPIAFMEGMVGRFFYEFGLTVTFATFVSLLVAFTLTPMCAGFFLTADDADPDKKYRFGRWWDRAFTRLADDYRSLLTLIMKHRLLTFLVCGSLFGASFLLAPFIGFEFVTEPDQKEFDITVKLPPGSSIDNTDRALKKIEDVLRGRPEIRFSFTKLGKTESLVGGSTTGTHLGEISVRLHDTVTISTDQFIAAITPQLSQIPEVELNVRKTGLLGTSESPIMIDILGDDLEVLQRIESQMLAIVKRTPGTLDVLSSLQTGKPE